jgi:hypothetical protein
VNDPSKAFMSDEMRSLVRRLSKRRRFTIAIVTGRRRDAILDFVQLKGLYYAGSHGFDIVAPGNVAMKQVATTFLPTLARVRTLLTPVIAAAAGAALEDNTYSLSVHHRNCGDDATVAALRASVAAIVAAQNRELRTFDGKKVIVGRTFAGCSMPDANRLHFISLSRKIFTFISFRSPHVRFFYISFIGDSAGAVMKQGRGRSLPHAQQSSLRFTLISAHLTSIFHFHFTLECRRFGRCINGTRARPFVTSCKPSFRDARSQRQVRVQRPPRTHTLTPTPTRSPPPTPPATPPLPTPTSLTSMPLLRR